MALVRKLRSVAEVQAVSREEAADTEEKMQVCTTLKQLRAERTRKDRYAHLRQGLGKNYGDDTPINIVEVLRNNGLNDALWIPESALAGEHIVQRYRLFALVMVAKTIQAIDLFCGVGGSSLGLVRHTEVKGHKVSVVAQSQRTQKANGHRLVTIIRLDKGNYSDLFDYAWEHKYDSLDSRPRRRVRIDRPI